MIANAVLRHNSDRLLSANRRSFETGTLKRTWTKLRIPSLDLNTGRYLRVNRRCPRTDDEEPTGTEESQEGTKQKTRWQAAATRNPPPGA